MKKIVFILTFLLSITAFAKNEHKHKSLASHEHGSIKLEMAVEGKTLEIELTGPAESFLGFEHAPKSEKEKAAFNNAEQLWKKDLLTKLFLLDAKLNCTITEVQFKQELEEDGGSHSEVDAEAKISCIENLAGQNVTVEVKKYFTKMKKIKIDLVSTEMKTIQSTKISEIIKL